MRKLRLVETRCALCGADDPLPQASGRDFEYDTSDDEFHFVRCRRCDHVYLDPRPHSSELGVIYPSNYYSFTGTRHPLVARAQRVWESGKVRLYRDRVGEGPRRLLDVGCGDGRLLGLLREYGPPGWTPVGLEFDASAAARCREKGFEVHAERIEDFAQKPAEQGRYDAVIMLQLIEHVEDPAQLCTHVHALLAPGGAFIIETPHLGGLDYRLFRRRGWGHYHFPRHWNLFSTAALVRMLEEHGFEVVDRQYLISTSAWVISHHNYFEDQGWPRWLVRFFHYQNPLLLAIFVVVDSLRIRLGLETSNQRVIARRRA